MSTDDHPDWDDGYLAGQRHMLEEVNRKIDESVNSAINYYYNFHNSSGISVEDAFEVMKAHIKEKLVELMVKL